MVNFFFNLYTGSRRIRNSTDNINTYLKIQEKKTDYYTFNLLPNNLLNEYTCKRLCDAILDNFLPKILTILAKNVQTNLVALIHLKDLAYKLPKTT